MTKHLLILSLCLSSVLTAQTKQKVPTKTVRFIPLGDIPTFETDYSNGGRKQKPAPPGSMPPAGTVLQVEPEEAKALGLRLKAFTDFADVKTTTGGFKVFSGGQIGTKPWYQSKFPSNKLSLVVLCKDNKTMSWNEPMAKVLPEDLLSFPKGRIRIVNVSDRSVAVILGEGGKAFMVNPGKSTMKSMKVGEVPIQVAVKDAAGAWKKIINNNIVMRKNSRVQSFVYKALPGNRSSVKFHWKCETP